MLKPGILTPPLTISLIDGDRWALHESRPVALTLMVFHRGRFCRYCREYLSSLNTLASAFEMRGVSIATASTDTIEEGRRLREEDGIDLLRIGYGMSRGDIEACGLFASERRVDDTLVRFAEPALWLVRPDGRLYANFQNSMSCAPNDLASLLGGIDVLAAQNFPPRGEA